MKATDTKTANAPVQAKKAGATPFFSPEKGDSVLEKSPAFFGENAGVGAFFSPPPPVQAKLTIGAPDDPYEREADATAEKVVQRLAQPDAPALSEPVQSIQRMPAPVQRACAECEQEEPKEAEEQIKEKVQRKPMFEAPGDGEGTVQRECNDCEQEDQGGVQRQADGAGQTAAPANFSTQLQSSKGGGSALPAEVSSQMGQAMGADFSGVRVHTGSEAAGMSQSIQAQAFTHGSDIYFNEGKYDTGSTDGKQLLAHELTHTVQQGGAGVKRFGSLEHKQVGDAGSNNATYSIDIVGSHYKFELTHGDIVALSGDYFDPRDFNSNGQLNPDGLFILARRPSLNPGMQVGTQDEIVYALFKINPTDQRFATGGIWESLSTNDAFSIDVRNAHDDRYLRLASNNMEHFVSPSQGYISNSLGQSAGGSYRALHEQAILAAYFDGRQGQSEQEGLMREAAAQHFLTDAFAAGHIRTPRLSIRQFWRGKYPLFFANFKKKIALDVAKALNDQDVGYIKTIPGLYKEVLKDVEENTKNIPELGIDDLVAMVAHDQDNKEGLWVKNDLGHKWKTFGDSNLNPKMSSLFDGTFFDHIQEFELITSSVEKGINDIRYAFEYGKENPHITGNEVIFSHVKLMGTGLYFFYNKYAPELYLPQLDEDKDNGTQQWSAASFEDLWDMRIRTDKEETYGAAISKSVTEGEIKDKLVGIGEKFPESKYLIIYPRFAYIMGFLNPLLSHPKEKLLEIIHFDPSRGLFFMDTDDAVMDENLSANDMKGLTTQQRATRIKNVLSGWTTDNEQDKIVELFESATPDQRREVFEMVENRTWNGDWKHGLWVIDDDLWDDLSSERLKKLKSLLNEGFAPVT